MSASICGIDLVESAFERRNRKQEALVALRDLA